MTADPLNTTPWIPLPQDWGDGEGVTVIPADMLPAVGAERHDRSDVTAVAPDEPTPVRATPSTSGARGPARLDSTGDRHREP